MSDNKQPVDKHEEADSFQEKQRVAYQVATGIGGGVVGAAIGGLLGRRVGGVCGGIVGAVTGALVGKGTAEYINRSVESVTDTTKIIAEAVNHNVNDAANIVKDTLEQLRSFVVGAEDAIKDIPGKDKSSDDYSQNNSIYVEKNTTEQVKPFIVSESDNRSLNNSIYVGKYVGKNTSESLKSLLSIEDSKKDTPELLNPSVVSVKQDLKDTPEKLKSKSQNSKLHQEQRVTVPLLRSSEEHSSNQDKDVDEQVSQKLAYGQKLHNSKKLDIQELKYKVFQQRLQQLSRKQQETERQFEQEETPSKTERIQKLNSIGEFIIGSGVLTLIGITLGFLPKANLFQTKSPEYSQMHNYASVSTAVTTSEKMADGWIFLGNVNTSSSLASKGNPLIKGLQSTDSPIIPSVGSIVTVTARPGVTLRSNRPVAPKFSHKQQKALAVLKRGEKLEILQLDFVPTPSTSRQTRVWAKVYRCGSTCN